MKKLILSVLTCCTLTVYAQKIDFSMSGGTGKSYIFESADRSVNVHYTLPASLITEIKFTPKEKAWGVKLRFHHLQSDVTGENWMNKTPLDGNIQSLTTSLLLEKEITKRKFSYGYNFGLGITKETVQPQRLNIYNRTVSNYASLSAGGHLSYKMCRNFDLQILPVLLWQNPCETIRVLTGKSKPNFALEDLSAVVNFGIRYRLTH